VEKISERDKFSAGRKSEAVIDGESGELTEGEDVAGGKDKSEMDKLGRG